MNIILFGPPGAGKGTQSDFLVSKFQLFKLSTGDLLRNEISKKTELGKKNRKYSQCRKISFKRHY